MIIPLTKVIFGEYVREWCILPYEKYYLKNGDVRYTNPNGCPMYGTRPTCPPEAPMLDEISCEPYYLVIQEFDLEAQAKRMKERHKDWSEKQCKCYRYWQRTLHNKLVEEASQHIKNLKILDAFILERPEANGVNLFSTCRLHGIILKKNPQKIVKKMVMIGRQKISARRWFA